MLAVWLWVKPVWVCTFKTHRPYRGKTPSKCGEYSQKQRQNIPEANNKEFNLPCGSEALPEEGTLNFRPRKKEQSLEKQNGPFNKETRPWKQWTLFQGHWKTIWKPDSYWVILNLRAALCTLHSIREKWLDGGGNKVRKMGPVIDGVWRTERGATGMSLFEGWVDITLCMVECRRNPYIQGERRKKREGKGKEEKEKEEATTISCLLCEPTS